MPSLAYRNLRIHRRLDGQHGKAAALLYRTSSVEYLFDEEE
jgi:hypothetical protein